MTYRHVLWQCCLGLGHTVCSSPSFCPSLSLTLSRLRSSIWPVLCVFCWYISFERRPCPHPTVCWPLAHRSSLRQPLCWMPPDRLLSTEKKKQHSALFVPPLSPYVDTWPFCLACFIQRCIIHLNGSLTSCPLLLSVPDNFLPPGLCLFLSLFLICSISLSLCHCLALCLFFSFGLSAWEVNKSLR